MRFLRMTKELIEYAEHFEEEFLMHLPDIKQDDTKKLIDELIKTVQKFNKEGAND